MKHHILIKVLSAIFLAIIAGWLAGPDNTLFGVTWVDIFSLIGQLFLNALTLVVVPLVVSSIITGSARMGAEGRFGSLGLRTIALFLGTNAVAILIGLITVVAIGPGEVPSTPKTVTLSTVQEMKLETIEHAGEKGGFARLSEMLYKLVPANILAAASQGQMLGLIGFSLVFGYFLSKIDPQPAAVMLSFWQGVFQIMMKITHLVMKALPFGVFALVAKIVSTAGIDSLLSVAWFGLTMLIALAIYAGVFLTGLLKWGAGVDPLKHVRAMSPALITAFSTSSSAVTLPVTIECVEEQVGVSNRICSFAIPLGTSLNLSASALGICVSVLFVAQTYGMEMSFSTLFFVFLMTFLSAVSVAGIPSACLVSVVLILHTLGLPPDGVGLILAVERVLDMCRTAVNVYGNSCCAVVLARSEGETLMRAEVLPAGGRG